MRSWTTRPALGRVIGVATLGVALGLALPTWAQNPVDPFNSTIENYCDYNIINAPVRAGDDFGDLGIIITCLDEFGNPVEDIPGDAFRLVNLDGPEEWPLTAEPTDAEGRTYLVGPAAGSTTLVHGTAGVIVEVGSQEILVDNLGAGIPIELRTPDLFADGIVDLADLAAFAEVFDCCENTEYCLKADYSGDGCVTLEDFVIFGTYFGVGKSAAGDRPLDRQPFARDQEDLFFGCVQLDLGSDDDPNTIEDEVFVPTGLFILHIVADDFRGLSGVDLEFGYPPELVFLGVNPVPEFPIYIPADSAPGNERFVITGDCVPSGPLFVYEFQFFNSVPAVYSADMFPIAHARLSNCYYPPLESDACIGTPTPCDVSYIDAGAEFFITCPGGDLDTSDIVTMVMLDQDGNGVPGLLAEDFRISLVDELGSDYPWRVRFTPMADATDENGELPFLFELRDECGRESCLDLAINVQYSGCDLVGKKRVRTINGVPAVSEGGPSDDVINLADVSWWGQALYTADECRALTRNYRCPIVTNQDVALVMGHMGHSCIITAVPQTMHAGSVLMHQNEPNPFNPLTELRIELPHAADHATLQIYDLHGRRVATIWAGPLPAGPSLFTWNGRDSGDRAVASGVYFARLRALGEESSVRMLLLR